ncbi:hypothetical protein [Robertmurraya kyonggiensis]|nr:hypothetical protein [Robertmurraya kyonggiensis]
MSDEERQSIMAQLALIQGVNPSVFERYSDEQLQAEMKKLYGEDETL